MITFLLLDFLGGSQRILWKNENAVYRRLQISALVPEILKFEKGIKYANELTDDVIYSNVKQANISTCLLEYVHEAPFANMKMGHQRWPEILLTLSLLQGRTEYVLYQITYMLYGRTQYVQNPSTHMDISAHCKNNKTAHK